MEILALGLNRDGVTDPPTLSIGCHTGAEMSICLAVNSGRHHRVIAVTADGILPSIPRVNQEVEVSPVLTLLFFREPTLQSLIYSDRRQCLEFNWISAKWLAVPAIVWVRVTDPIFTVIDGFKCDIILLNFSLIIILKNFWI